MATCVSLSALSPRPVAHTRERTTGAIVSATSLSAPPPQSPLRERDLKEEVDCKQTAPKTQRDPCSAKVKEEALVQWITRVGVKSHRFTVNAGQFLPSCVTVQKHPFKVPIQSPQSACYAVGILSLPLRPDELQAPRVLCYPLMSVTCSAAALLPLQRTPIIVLQKKKKKGPGDYLSRVARPRIFLVPFHEEPKAEAGNFIQSLTQRGVCHSLVGLMPLPRLLR